MSQDTNTDTNANTHAHTGTYTNMHANKRRHKHAHTHTRTHAHMQAHTTAHTNAHAKHGTSTLQHGASSSWCVLCVSTRLFTLLPRRKQKNGRNFDCCAIHTPRHVSPAAAGGPKETATATKENSSGKITPTAKCSSTLRRLDTETEAQRKLQQKKTQMAKCASTLRRLDAETPGRLDAFTPHLG